MRKWCSELSIETKSGLNVCYFDLKNKAQQKNVFKLHIISKYFMKIILNNKNQIYFKLKSNHISSQ
jgi:hypothetical protein